jgi:Tol biopolymer transport system component
MRRKLMIAFLLLFSTLVYGSGCVSKAPLTGTIAFSSNRDGAFEIFVTKPDGTGVKKLTEPPENKTMPFFSPDGRKIAYLSIREEKEEGRKGTLRGMMKHEASTLWIMNADGSGKQKLLEDSKGFTLTRSETRLLFASDGSILINATIFKEDPPTVTLKVNSANGQHETLVKDVKDVAMAPSGSPLAFVADAEKGNPFEALFVMNRDGSGRENITPGQAGTLLPAVPIWSPRGNRIAFANVDNLRHVQRDVWVVNPDGKEGKAVTDSRKYDAMAPPLHGYPCWSPDGSRIVFVSDREKNKEIYIMDSDGKNQVNITRNSAADEFPSWGRE